jgi:hypothetical protein
MDTRGESTTEARVGPGDVGTVLRIGSEENLDGGAPIG